MLIKIKDGIAEASPQLLAFKCFKEFRDKDKSKNKQVYQDLLVFLYFMYSYDSIYFDMPEEIRKEAVLNGVFDETKLDLNNPLTKDCIEIYKSKQPVEVSLLENALSAVYKLGQYLKECDFSLEDENGKKKYDPKEIRSILKDVGDILVSIKELRKSVKEVTAEEYVEQKFMFE